VRVSTRKSRGKQIIPDVDSLRRLFALLDAKAKFMSANFQRPPCPSKERRSACGVESSATLRVGFEPTRLARETSQGGERAVSRHARCVDSRFSLRGISEAPDIAGLSRRFGGSALTLAVRGSLFRSWRLLFFVQPSLAHEGRKPGKVRPWRDGSLKDPGGRHDCTRYALLVASVCVPDLRSS